MGLIVAMVYAAGSLVCHQLPERSFFWGDHPFPVCARCTGLYLSAAVGFAIWCGGAMVRGARVRGAMVRPSLALRVVAIAAIPTAVSFATGVVGLWDGSNAIRALLAVPLGLSAGVVVAAVATKDLR